ncbi:zinc ribbon domain-containing protein [Actinocorallia sp. API 0066]|uniref:Zn-ribbon domain-containing OB-fold protein n=1 Tax=Actinocorallia sp. API 0066 TaxID=2896846 RepID=UPI001E35AA22|nr:zinc ribbon domain-containing protein [Actinocorallia sp. API 0066]MCD0453049.1 zinc ribbon domain-containing protein [Actinocorallia sp. API 0066]
MRIAAHPGLYDPAAPTPVLSGTRCARCRHVYFPPLGIGCEVCGADEEHLTPVPIDAVGAVHSRARVHRHLGAPLAPFTIAEIRLDAGPLIRGTLAGDGPRIGDRVHAVWAVTDTRDDGAETVEPVFTTTAPNGAAS